MKQSKRILTLILVLTLCLSLTLGLSACGSRTGSDDNSSYSSTGEDSREDKVPDGFVYTAEYVPLKYTFTGYPNSFQYGDGRFLCTAYEKIADNTPEGVVPDYEGQYWEYGEVMYRISMDGSVEKLPGYTALKAEEEEGVDSSVWSNGLTLLADGTILELVVFYRSWSDAPEGTEQYSDTWYEYYQSEEHYLLRHLDADGSELGTTSLDALQARAEEDGSYFYPGSFTADSQGRFYFSCDSGIYVTDQNAQPIKTLSLGADGYINALLPLSDGRIGVTYNIWGSTAVTDSDVKVDEAYAIGALPISSGTNSSGLAFIDQETLQLDLNSAVPLTNPYECFEGGGDYGLYYIDGSNLMGVDLETGASEKVLNWINCDVNTGNLSGKAVLEDGRIAVLECEYEDAGYQAQIILLTKVPASSVPQKETLTLATQYLGWDVREAIIRFNRSHDDLRIEVEDYSEYNTEEDYSAGLTKLTTEILSGHTPDIVALDGLPVSQMIGAGLLEDLYPYLDSDSELSRDDILPNVLTALETDGSLYRTAASFSVQTLVGAADIVGEEPGWTVAEFKAALARMPQGCTPLSRYSTRDDMLNTVLYMELDDLIDWSTGRCSFNTPAFTDLLEFAAMFPETYDWESDDGYYASDSERISRGEQMLAEAYLYSFTDLQQYQPMFGDRAVCIGYPVSQGVGSVLCFEDSGYAICSGCRNKQAAWSFLRSFFTADYQEENAWSFPTNAETFNEKLKEAMTPEYQKDAQGNYVLDENGEKIELSRGGWSDGITEVEFFALTQEEADQLMSVITSATRTRNYYTDEKIIEVITSESAAFFAGQKSAQQVGELIQNKLSIYISEQM